MPALSTTVFNNSTENKFASCRIIKAQYFDFKDHHSFTFEPQSTNLPLLSNLW